MANAWGSAWGRATGAVQVFFSGSAAATAVARIYSGSSASEGPRRVRQPLHKKTTTANVQAVAVAVQADKKRVAVSSEVV